jgi:hypothetical protein
VHERSGISIEAPAEYATLFQEGITKTCAVRKEILVDQRKIIANKAEEIKKVPEVLKCY